MLPQTCRGHRRQTRQVILTSASEELLYRDVLLGVLRSRRSSNAPTAFPSVFFGLLHPHLPVTPALVFLGAVLAVIRIRTGSLLAASRHPRRSAPPT